MAVTKGQGNPPWTREETILALDLYLKCKGQIPSKADARVIELSELLRSLKLHPRSETNARFRNADGVGFKLQNLRQVDTGHGLANVSAMDRKVWKELGNDPTEVARLASLFRRSVSALRKSDGEEPDEEIEDDVPEGTLATRVHRSRERAKGLRRKLLMKRAREGGLSCEMCGRQYRELGRTLEDAPFEIHHVVPLATALESRTRLSDLALLCANCHRLIHRAMKQAKRWIGVKEASVLIATAKAPQLRP